MIAAGQSQPFEGTPKDAVEALHGVLLGAVCQQMGADILHGVFLSGGIDSSTVVTLMQAKSSRPVRTFTIGFDTPDYNEAEYAKAVTNYRRTEHTEMYVSARDALASALWAPSPSSPEFGVGGTRIEAGERAPGGTDGQWNLWDGRLTVILATPMVAQWLETA